VSTSHRIQKQSKLDRARQRLENAVEILEVSLVTKTPNNNDVDHDNQDLRQQIDDLKRQNTEFDEAKRIIAARLDRTIDRLRLAITE